MSRYAVDLIPERVETLATNLSKAYTLLENDLKQFTQFLATINGA